MSRVKNQMQNSEAILMDMKEHTYPVPVVRLIVLNKKGQVLILRRAGGTHSSNAWCLPGGKIDYGETVEKACIRELREETGLDCIQPEFLFYQDSLPYRNGDMHCINLYFHCGVSGEVALNNESSKFAWIGSQDMDKFEIVFKNDEGLRRFWKQD